jgi:signal transduction histidine kinase
MDQRTRQWAFLLAMSVMLVTGLVAATAVYAIRQVLHQDLTESAVAQTVIRVAKVRALAERMAGHARGYMLTADPNSLDLVTSDRRAFFQRLDMLVRTPDPGARGRFDEVLTAARDHDQALEAVLNMRRTGEATETVAGAFEENVRPLKDALDRSLDHLIETEEARLDSLDRTTEREASRLATVAAGAAVGALLISLALAVLLARAFASLRRKQHELQQTMARLEQANRDLDAFAGRIAHDLRTPLTPIVMMASHLKLSGDEKVVRAAERIERGAQAASRMLEGLLAFSRVGQRDETASVRAAQVVRDTLEDLGEKIAAAEIAVETRLDGEVIVACGEALFRQVVGNLIGNAVKFMAGRDERQLQVELDGRDDSCVLVVKDTGPGIPAQDLGKIFDPFYRVDRTPAGGTGLGLAIVRRIVEGHGGTVTAESSVGRGSTFRVVLPAGQPVRPPALHQPTARPRSPAEAHV